MVAIEPIDPPSDGEGLDFVEAVNGAEMPVEFERLDTCETCSGSGAQPGDTVYLVVQIHGKQLEHDYQWCCPPDTLCIVLDISDWSFKKWLLLNMRHVVDYLGSQGVAVEVAA